MERATELQFDEKDTPRYLAARTGHCKLRKGKGFLIKGREGVARQEKEEGAAAV